MYQVKCISKQYGNNLVLKDVTFALPNTGFVALVGQSGSGKSTLLNLLMGIDKPTRGQILYANKDIVHLRLKEKTIYQNQIIGVLFQHFNLFPELSNLENVIIPCLIKGESRYSATEKAIKLFQAYGLMNLLHRNFATLSGGEKQRIALLRALINNPQVILADEPTGALDTKNSVFIMEELKKLAKDHLVIVVSHNLELIKQYEDIRLTIHNGTIEQINCQIQKEAAFPIIKKHVHQSFLMTFIKVHFKKHIVRNLIVGGATCFSLLCLLLSLGYLNGAKSSIQKYKSESLQYNYATIAKKTIIEIPNSPIRISKLTRPEIKDISFLINEIKSVVITNNYQNVFPTTPTFIFANKEIRDVEFSPVYNFKIYERLLTQGKMPNDDFNTAVVNQEFLDHFHWHINDVLNQELTLSHVSTIRTKTMDSGVATDIVIFHQRIKIIGVVREFGYLNSPRIYYSYLGLENVLANYLLTNYSKAMGSNLTVVDAINFAKNDEANSSYSFNLFIEDLNEVDNLFRIKEKHDQLNDFDITSNSYVVTSSYQSMAEIIGTSLIVFLFIIIFATVFILIITSFANYTQNKKESAVLSILGASQKSIFHIYNLENIIVALTGAVLSFLLSVPFKNLANYYFATMFHLNDVVEIPFLSFWPILILIAIFVLIFLSTFIPFVIYKNGYIVEELKDE